jgi:hypothetical protein
VPGATVRASRHYHPLELIDDNAADAGPTAETGVTAAGPTPTSAAAISNSTRPTRQNEGSRINRRKVGRSAFGSLGALRLPVNSCPTIPVASEALARRPIAGSIHCGVSAWPQHDGTVIVSVVHRALILEYHPFGQRED